MGPRREVVLAGCGGQALCSLCIFHLEHRSDRFLQHIFIASASL